jgi:hypothetical protein
MDTCGSEKCLLTTVGNLTTNFTQAVSTRPTAVLQFPSAGVQDAIRTGTHDKVPVAGGVVPGQSADTTPRRSRQDYPITWPPITQPAVPKTLALSRNYANGSSVHLLSTYGTHTEPEMI